MADILKYYFTILCTKTNKLNDFEMTIHLGGNKISYE